MSGDVSPEWRVVRMRGGSRTISHPWMVVAPGCPDGRHPTRDCACKVQRTESDAWDYVKECSGGQA